MGYKITNYGIKKTYTKEERLKALKRAIEVSKYIMDNQIDIEELDIDDLLDYEQDKTD